MKIAAIVLGMIVVVLLAVLIFVPGPKATTGIPQSGAVLSPQPIVSSDGHVQVFSPAENQAIVSPVAILGTVTGGGWFFEATFPVKVLDGDGTVLGQGMAQAGGAPGNWMSTGSVPFTAAITFKTPKLSMGTIVLSKDNPSGLPQNAGELRIPIKF